MKELEPLRAVYDIAPLEERIGDAFAQNRLRMVLLVLFAMTALSLACVGLSSGPRESQGSRFPRSE